MRRVFKRAGAILAFLAILIAPLAFADEPTNPSEPPAARIGPPIGVTGAEPSLFGQLLAWLYARIGPPIG